jgi:hypothetical protein
MTQIKYAKNRLKGGSGSEETKLKLKTNKSVSTTDHHYVTGLVARKNEEPVSVTGGMYDVRRHCY